MWFVDADERISEATGQMINRLVREHGEKFEAILIPFKNYFCGRWIQHSGWWPGYTMPRVLKRGHFRFGEQLHSGVQLDGRQYVIPADPALAVDHFSYESLEHYLQKFNAYTTTEAKQFARQNRPWNWREATRHMTHDLWHYYEHAQGSRDGVHGWILAWLAGQYRWFSHAKLLDINREVTEQSGDVPRDLDEVVAVIDEGLAYLRRTAPVLPLGIVWRSPIWDPSGYACDSRALIRGLAAGERPLLVQEIRWNEVVCDLPRDEASLLRSLTRTARPRYVAAITNCIPTLSRPDPTASLNILRTTFETDRIPAFWDESLSQFDEIWVMSHHNQWAFQRGGVGPERLRVVQGCIDTELFHPEGERLPLPENLSGKFVFLSVFDWQLRKGWDLLLRAYVHEFVAEEAALLIKITRLHEHSWEQVKQQINGVLGEFGTTLEQRPDIVLWDRHLTNRELAALLPWGTISTMMIEYALAIRSC